MGRQVVVRIDTPQVPPHWALLERELLQAQGKAVKEFYDKYFDERGFLMCVPRWGGDDGPDDAAENMLNWTMLHALGADDIVLELYKKAWDGHLLQYTEAKTIEVPMARDGMYYKEFPVMFDWFHHGEWLSAFYLQGLSDPYDSNYLTRVRRYTGFYNGDDIQAHNWDSQHKLIRSMFNGSRGPLLRKATGLDWAGDPIEIQGRFKPGHGEHSFEMMIEHFKDYNDVAGDHPMNLSATTLGFNAFALTGDKRYADWVTEYANAWVERTEKNGGLVPSNIGLDGSIGGECDGKWYGGVYGWGFSVYDPATQQIAHRPSFQNRAHYGFANAYQLTGDARYINLWGEMIDKVNENAKQIDGKTMYPRSYGDEGWYNFQSEPFTDGALEVYYWSMDSKHRNRVPHSDWLDYLEGKNANYPVAALEQVYVELRKRLDDMHNDVTSPDTRMSDDMNNINPAVTGTLTQLMIGGLPTGRMGSTLHSRLRYFDPERRRAGIPEDVTALVEGMTADDVTVSLVNLNPSEHRTVIVQGGGYGEHQILDVQAGSTSAEVNDSTFAVRLAPASGERLTIRMRRYAKKPTLAFPWV